MEVCKTASRKDGKAGGVHSGGQDLLQNISDQENRRGAGAFRKTGTRAVKQSNPEGSHTYMIREFLEKMPRYSQQGKDSPSDSVGISGKSCQNKKKLAWTPAPCCISRGSGRTHGRRPARPRQPQPPVLRQACGRGTARAGGVGKPSEGQRHTRVTRAGSRDQRRAGGSGPRARRRHIWAGRPKVR